MHIIDVMSKASIWTKEELNTKLAPFNNEYSLRKLKLGSYSGRQVVEPRTLHEACWLLRQYFINVAELNEHKRYHKDLIKRKDPHMQFCKACCEA